MAFGGLEHVAHRTVIGDRVGLGQDGTEVVTALRVGLQHATRLRPVAVGALHVVQALGVVFQCVLSNNLLPLGIILLGCGFV